MLLASGAAGVEESCRTLVRAGAPYDDLRSALICAGWAQPHSLIERKHVEGAGLSA